VDPAEAHVHRARAVERTGLGHDRAMDLPRELLDLLQNRALCFVATLNPDGSPQLTQTWADTDGEHILINTVETHQKIKNVRRDARVALNIVDPDRPFRYFDVRGRVVGVSTDGAAEHIDKLSHRYTGKPYSFGRGGTRMLLTIEADKVR
jgi:PPOX class probable F420-dependent enzyme